MTDPQPRQPPRSTAYDIGLEFEATLSTQQRRQGAHYTPPDVAEALVEQAWRFLRHPTPVVCDPSCGGAVFLIAAAQRLRREGLDPADIVNRHLVGIDLNPDAVQAATTALQTWAREAGATREVTPRVVCADALFAGGQLQGGLFEDGPTAGLPADATIDLVIGNPPFQNQLDASTARTADARRAMAQRFGPDVRAYVDIAAVFQLRALELAAPDGVVCLVQPRSFLAARDAETVRRRMLAAGALASVWLPRDKVFGAEVDVCATTLQLGAAARPVEVTGGRLGEMPHGEVDAELLAGSATWSALWARARGVPSVAPPAGHHGTIGDRATATAGFRDEFYALVDHLSDGPLAPGRGARVISTAMIDPLTSSWATREVKIGGGKRTSPWVDRDALDDAAPRVGNWVGRLAVPKVLVATQTKVIEAALDADGDTVPLTPVLAVVPMAVVPMAVGADAAPAACPSQPDDASPVADPSPVAMLVAALSVPAASAWAATRFGGGGMSQDSMRLSARQVLQIPLPVDHDLWRHAARASLDPPADGDATGWRELGRLLNHSWRIDDDDLVDWWLARLPQMSRRSRRLR
ncbi:MAG: N-6 DNA methylase [Microthrixaceae bacterium]